MHLVVIHLVLVLRSSDASHQGSILANSSVSRNALFLVLLDMCQNETS